MLSLTRAAGCACFIGCLGGTTLSTVAALAADSDDIVQAREAFDKGLALEAARSWEAALAEYRRVAKVRATSAVRFHIARCLEQIGQWTEAIGAYELAAGDARGPDRAEIVRLSTEAMERLRRSLPSLRIDSDPDSQASRLRLDGVDILAESYRTPRSIDPGRHELESRAGERAELHVITLAPGEQKVFELLASPPATGPKAPQGDPGATVRAQPSSGRGPAPWLLISGGAASSIGAVAFGLLAHAKEIDLRNACYTADVCPTSAKAIHDQGVRYTLAANIAGGVGLAGMGAGLVWWLWPVKDAQPPVGRTGLRLAIAPARVMLSGSF